MVGQFVAVATLLLVTSVAAAQDQGKLWMSLRGSNPQVPRTTVGAR